jgi:CRISPR/Cas system-associated exonuclease Cas4 (RecB family)
MRTVRASEIGAYEYCRRAWWYQRQGMPNENQAELAAGKERHERHGRIVLTSGCIRLLAYVLIMAALLAAAAWITQALLQAFV